MKLNKLTLSNIGPYKGTHVIDFNELTNSLYLITGPTGSGKSYIFDSICYALYGKTSGGSREASDFKSKYADITDVASVTLNFSYHNKNYEIYREPKQLRKNSKKTDGEYKIKETPTVSKLTLSDGLILTKGVDEKIIDIIGLSYDQFKMTMMIAQGDFYSLINASTKDREEIFRKILNTAKLNNFNEKLKELYNTKKLDIEIIKNNIKTIRNSFSFNDELMQVLANDNEILSSIMPLIHNELEKNKLELQELNNKYNLKYNLMLKINNSYTKANNDNNNLNTYLLEKEKNDFLRKQESLYKEKELKINLASKAKDIINLINNLNKTKKDIGDLEEQIKKDNEASITIGVLFNDAKVEYQEKDKIINLNNDIKINIDNLKNKLKELDNYNKLKSEINYFSNIQKELLDKKANLSKSLENKEKELKEIALITKLPSNDVEIEKINISITSLDKEISELNDKEKLIDNYLLLKDNHIKLTNKFADISVKAKEATDLALDYEINYHKSIAGILAKDLKEGVPCPVCGSTHHERLACISADLSKEKLDELKKAASYATDLKVKASSELEINLNNIKNLENQISLFIKDKFDSNNIRLLYTNLVKEKENEKKPLYEKLKELNEYKDKITKALEKEIAVTKEIEILKSDILALDTNITKNEMALSKLNGQIDLLKDLANLNKEGLTKDILSLENKFNENKLKVENIENYYQLLSTKYTSITTKIKNDGELRQKLSDDLIKARNELTKEVAKNKFDDINHAKSAYIKDELLDELKKDLETYKVNLSSSDSLIKNYINLGYDKLTYVDLTILEEEKKKLEDEFNIVNDNKTNLQAKYEHNLRNYNELIRLNSNNDKSLKEFEEIKELYEVSDGKLSGHKVNFEVYYQLQVFGEILRVASYKFNKMTDGRYELLEGKPKGGNGQIGLEIDVKDLYNGEIRPVSGLSGGESFQASMSLALAFSEIIQIKAGGVELNSMFIDEGFGTLDSEMLDNTKKTLLEIGTSTNRKIGIISHVSELTRSIQSKIVVSKSDKGSSFKIVNE